LRVIKKKRRKAQAGATRRPWRASLQYSRYSRKPTLGKVRDTEMCSGFKAGSYLRLIDVGYLSRELGLAVLALGEEDADLPVLPHPALHVQLQRDLEPGKGNSNSHGARPVHLIITTIKWIRTSRLSIHNSLCPQPTSHTTEFR